MPVYTLTARIADESGRVRAMQRSPYAVIEIGESLKEVFADLEKLVEEREEAKDHNHPKHHHWWRVDYEDEQ